MFKYEVLPSYRVVISQGSSELVLNFLHVVIRQMPAGTEPSHRPLPLSLYTHSVSADPGLVVTMGIRGEREPE